MSTSTSRAADADAAEHPRQPDTRTYWRTVMAAIAPIPFLALAASNLVAPERTDADAQTSLNATLANPGHAQAALWLSGLFIIGLFPAVVTLLWACRRRAPRLTAWVGTITLTGAAAASLVPGRSLINVVAVDQHLDPATIVAINDGIQGQPATLLPTLLFFLGIVTAGRILLGILLWRSKITPRWMAIALIAAAPIDVLGPPALVVNSGAQALSWLLVAVAFTGVSRTLLRTGNDDFDLPAQPDPQQSHRPRQA